MLTTVPKDPRVRCPNHHTITFVMACRRCMATFWLAMRRLRELDQRGELPG